jgi:signal transduction histidine kinase
MSRRGDLRCADPLLDAPRADDSIDDHGHLVQFYENDSFLAQSVRDFVVAGFEQGEAAIIVATKEHRQAIDELLEDTEFDLQALRNSGCYVLLDASETLSRFLVDGEPEPALFSAAVGSVVARAAEAGNGVRIFGEMVALLWADDHVAEAIRLEELWNELAEAHPFSLLCAYPMSGFDDSDAFKGVCSTHTRVIPTESYTALVTMDDRMRAITELQQQVSAIDQKHREMALELHDTVVQGLAAAKMALELNHYEVLETSVTATLQRATEMVSKQLDEASGTTRPLPDAGVAR